MLARQALVSSLHLFVVFAFFIAGFFFISLPYLPEIKTQIFEKCTLIGLFLFLASLVLLLGFYALDRGRYLVIRMGASVDLKVVYQILEECFVRQFPNKIFLSEVEIGRKSRLEIKVALVPLDENAREELFLEAEKALSALLKHRFGYVKPFYLIVKL